MTTTTQRHPPPRGGVGAARRPDHLARPGRGPRPGSPAGPAGTRTAPPQRPYAPPAPPVRSAPSARPAPSAPGRPANRGAAPRTPFVFLVVGLLSGGLICLLLLNTILAAGTFQITSLQQSNAALARQQQALQQQIANSQAPETLARRARQLGMVPVRDPRFVSLPSGRVYGQAQGPATAHRPATGTGH